MLKSGNYIQARLFLLSLLFNCSTGPDSSHGGNASPDAPPEAVEMVRVPGGTFRMGGRSALAYEDEFPLHTVHVSPFLMDATEVTNAEFARFVKSTGYVTVAERAVEWEQIKEQVAPGMPRPPDSLLAAGSLVFSGTEGPVDLRDYSQWWKWTRGADWRHPEGPGSSLKGMMDHPVVHVCREDAEAYADWAKKRLPTEAEWEWAASGGRQVIYPWGDEPIEQAYDKANFWQGFFPYKNEKKDGYYGTAPVKSFPPNNFGLYDMAGNVWEWCADRYSYNAYAGGDTEKISKNPQGPERSYDPREPLATKYVIRGGSFLCNDSYCSGYRVARRMASSGDSGFNHTGFRCVKNID